MSGKKRMAYLWLENNVRRIVWIPIVAFCATIGVMTMFAIAYLLLLWAFGN